MGGAARNVVASKQVVVKKRRRQPASSSPSSLSSSNVVASRQVVSRHETPRQETSSPAGVVKKRRRQQRRQATSSPSSCQSRRRVISPYPHIQVLDGGLHVGRLPAPKLGVHDGAGVRPATHLAAPQRREGARVLQLVVLIIWPQKNPKAIHKRSTKNTFKTIIGNRVHLLYL